MKYILAVLLIFLSLAFARSMFLSFRAQNITDYIGTGPQFDIQTHLGGDILSEGVVYGPMGRMTSSFVATMNGTWDGNTGVLTENFTYSNDRSQQRKWTITVQDEKNFTATADDIVGTAVGRIEGSVMHIKYRIVLPKEAGGQTLDVNDWLFLTDNGVIMNRSELYKFGIRVAELVAVMRPAGGVSN